ncbi:hypothetical protein SDC9_183041 [bioreactor metagenome]|uniref:Uncharacterized protein n=1 Tax=bioreactor metagenome TaxID=1076179 RepID=A0A645HIQ2_9ZZZZ
MIAQQGCKQIICLLKLGHRSFGLEESSRRQENHRTVDGPTDDHRQQGIEKLIFQLFFDNFIIFQVPLPALNHFRMQKQVMRHHHGTQHTHDHNHGTIRKSRSHPSPDC